VPNPALDVFEGPPGIALVPEPVEGFGPEAELNDDVAGEVLWGHLAPLLVPQA
jgi:hypothetical protein